MNFNKSAKCKAVTFSYDDGVTQDILKLKYIYEGHEVAAHTLTHPNLIKCDEHEVIRQVEHDRLKLSELAGYEVAGMAYPCGVSTTMTMSLGLLRKIPVSNFYRLKYRYPKDFLHLGALLRNGLRS